MLIPPLVLGLLVAGLWAFPAFWYRNDGAGQMRWLAERTEVPGWTYENMPVEASAEKLLVADRTFSAEYKNGNGAEIHVFSAKRYTEKANEIGLFIHTPDRCWVDAGWTIEPEAAPSFKQIQLHGAEITVERRIYDFRGRRELVYFFGLQGGRPLPYRLDHYLSTGLRSAPGRNRELIRASDSHFWARLWDSFLSRRDVRGPKQFVRISTMLGSEEQSVADARLESFLHQWLVPADYQAEKSAWMK